MEFKEILQKLKFSDRYNLITKKIIENIRHIQKAELMEILETLQSTVDIEFQVKLLSILSAILMISNTYRHIVIKWLPLYDTLNAILGRGLPMKTVTTLNFISALLYVDDDIASRSQALTMHARNVVRTSGCLATMAYMFANKMMYMDTWKALCRCIAEVCRGSEVNQTVCSPLIPTCIQRCLRGNLDAFPVLLSLLSNHNRNTNMFLDINGSALFNKMEYLRYEVCLQLLNAVLLNADATVIRALSQQTRVHGNLKDLLKSQSPDSRIYQWSKINLYYLECKLEEQDIPFEHKTNVTVIVTPVKNTQDENFNDTQILFRNIMSEIRTCPMKPVQNPWKELCKESDKILTANNLLRRYDMKPKLYINERETFQRKPAKQSYNFCNENQSFSFIVDENRNDDCLLRNRHSFRENASVRDTNILSHSFVGTVINSTVYSRQKCNRNNLCESQQTSNNSFNAMEFKPAFVSTPIKMMSEQRLFSHKNSSMRSLKRLQNRNRVKKKTAPKSFRKEKDNDKHTSMSSRLFKAINESCTTFMKSVKNVFTGGNNSNKPLKDATNDVLPNEDDKSYCSYSFTNYMKKREEQQNSKRNISSAMNTLNAMSVCKTCDDTFLLRQKLANDDQLKLTVNKLKLGINLYGCDFKKMSRTMWPRETYMTPNVLYTLYRKLILK